VINRETEGGSSNMAHSARVLVALEIYKNCEIRATPLFAQAGHEELMFTLTGPYHDDVNIMFERPVLERFLQLAREALELPVPQDARVDPPKLVSTARTLALRPKSYSSDPR
jgi:hypothetical protein